MAQEIDMEELRAYFAQDKFATECLGARVDEFEADPYRAVVSMDVDLNKHANAQGFVMGGVFMAICDFALAVCSNGGGQVPCCSTNHSMECMNRCKGERLIATAICTKNGRSLCFYEVELKDELGTYVGRMTATCMRTPGVCCK